MKPLKANSWNTLFTSLLLFAATHDISQAKYKSATFSKYKPKTDSVTYQDRSIKFRRGITVSKVGGYFAYLGTGLLLAGTALQDEKLLLGGAGFMAVGLPTIGFASLYMKSSIHSEARFRPNGFPWYFASLALGGVYYYGIKEKNLTLGAKAGGGILIGAFTMTTWMKFAGFRNLMASRYSEYALYLSPILYQSQGEIRGAGVQTTLQF